MSSKMGLNLDETRQSSNQKLPKFSSSTLFADARSMANSRGSTCSPTKEKK
jgi:hypothetical protein